MGRFAGARHAGGARAHAQEMGWKRFEQMKPSGSFAKGTAIQSRTDIDLFISLSASTTDTLQEIFAAECDGEYGGSIPPQLQRGATAMVAAIR